MEFFNAGSSVGLAAQTLYEVPHYRWATDYLNTFLVQNDAYSIYRLEIETSRALNTVKTGRIVIDFPTLGDYGVVYSNDLGTSNYHGEQFSCLKGPKSTVDFDCYIFFGNGILPANIIIYPQNTMVVGAIIETFLPPVLNPAFNMTEVRMRVLGQDFDDATLLWNTFIELERDIFVAIELSVSEISKAMPVFTPSNLVGESSGVTFNFNADKEIKDKVAGGFDRVILQVDKSQLIFLNNNIDKLLNCPGWDVNVYADQDLIEFSPTSTISINSNVNLSCLNLFNQ